MTLTMQIPVTRASATLPANAARSSFPMARTLEEDKVHMLLTSFTLLPIDIAYQKARQMIGENFKSRNASINQNRGGNTTIERELCKAKNLQEIGFSLRYLTFDERDFYSKINACVKEVSSIPHADGSYPRIEIYEVLNQKFYDVFSEKQTCLLNLVLEQASKKAMQHWYCL